MTFDQWARGELPRLLRFTTVLCGNPHLAEDVVQDVLLKAHRRWDQIEKVDRPDAYLRRMVVNEFLSWRRKWSRYVPRAEILPTEHATDHAVQHADRDQLVAELVKLPRRQRAVLVLRYYGGLTDHEIAETLGCSASTVRAHASRALAALRIQLTPSNTRTGATHAY